MNDRFTTAAGRLALVLALITPTAMVLAGGRDDDGGIRLGNVETLAGGQGSRAEVRIGASLAPSGDPRGVTVLVAGDGAAVCVRMDGEVILGCSGEEAGAAPVGNRVPQGVGRGLDAIPR